MNRSDLEKRVPVHPPGVVRLIDIPNPYRSEFDVDMSGTTQIEHGLPTPCMFAEDWFNWLAVRFRPNYRMLFPQDFRLISDEELAPDFVHWQGHNMPIWYPYRHDGQFVSEPVVLLEDVPATVRAALVWRDRPAAKPSVSPRGSEAVFLADVQREIDNAPASS